MLESPPVTFVSMDKITPEWPKQQERLTHRTDQARGRQHECMFSTLYKEDSVNLTPAIWATDTHVHTYQSKWMVHHGIVHAVVR